ncbi:MAG: deoxyribonuclease V [Spirochaetota bacterium]
MHEWTTDVQEAKRIQEELRQKVVLQKPKGWHIDSIAGIDLGYDKKTDLGFCSVLVFDFPSLQLQKTYNYYAKVSFPYIPGFLSFREAPLIIQCLNQLETMPDLLFFDGQGIAHPKRFGIASHVGILLDIASIGCAKSRLIGEYNEPEPKKGAFSELRDKNGEILGNVLRTRDNVKPVFISPGHLLDVSAATEISLACTTRYRIPEPTRLADIAVKEFKNQTLATLP